MGWYWTSCQVPANHWLETTIQAVPRNQCLPLVWLKSQLHTQQKSHRKHVPEYSGVGDITNLIDDYIGGNKPN
jgi:hypothetical protein